MKIICEQNDLFKGVDIVSKAVPVRTPMSILECILIDATNGYIKLSANDTEIGIETKVNGQIEVPGKIAINAKMLFNVVRSMPESSIVIESNELNNIVISCENSNFENIIGKPGNDFVELPMNKNGKPVEISQYSLKEMIRQTIFSVSDSDTNKIFTGELFDIKDNKLRIIAMDGLRISIRNIELNSSYEEKKVVIPGKTLSEISKIIGNSTEEKVNIYFTENNVIFEFNDTTVVTRILEGEFFNVDNMLSKDYSTFVKVNRKSMLDCVKRANLLVKETDKKPIVMNVDDSTINISIISSIGSLKDNIDIEKEGLDIKIGFNPKFFIDVLNIVDDENINIYMDSSISPCFIKNDNEDYIYLILPVKLND